MENELAGKLSEPSSWGPEIVWCPVSASPFFNWTSFAVFLILGSARAWLLDVVVALQVGVEIERVLFEPHWSCELLVRILRLFNTKSNNVKRTIWHSSYSTGCTKADIYPELVSSRHIFARNVEILGNLGHKMICRSFPRSSCTSHLSWKSCSSRRYGLNITVEMENSANFVGVKSLNRNWSHVHTARLYPSGTHFICDSVPSYQIDRMAEHRT